jgi:hypothetical protein
MLSFDKFVLRQDHTQLVIVYPGRFQPAHKNHAAVYTNIVDTFPQAIVYVSTTNDVKPDSPFSFDERKIMLEAAGVPEKAIVLCRNPYVANEIKIKHSLPNTKMLFAVGAKDMDPAAPRFSIGLKKNGEPTYMQLPDANILSSITDRDIASLATADKHGYVCIAPTLIFNLQVGTKQVKIKGATQIRQLYREASENTRKDIITQLYGSFREDIFNIFNNKLT